MTTTTFRIALDNYISKLQELSDEYFKKELPNSWSNGMAPKYGYEHGKRWVKVHKADAAQKSVFCFIDPTTGDIYKAAGWKAPAKGIRGSIYSNNPPLTLGALYK